MSGETGVDFDGEYVGRAGGEGSGDGAGARADLNDGAAGEVAQ